MPAKNTSSSSALVAGGRGSPLYDIEAEVGIVDVEKGLSTPAGHASKARDGGLSVDSITVHEETSSEEEGSEQDADVDDPPTPEPKPSCCGDQLKKMRTTADWWSLWIGLASFSLGAFYYLNKSK